VRTRIALLIESSTSWGTGIIAGVGQHAAAAGLDWDLWHEPHGRNEKLLLPVGWRPDGVIARITSGELVQAVRRAGIPTVDVSWYRLDPAIPRCSIQEANAAEVSARYLFDLGLRRFAYVGSGRRPGYADLFEASFVAWLEDRGLPIARFDAAAWPDRSKRGPDDGLARWLGSLAKPVGLLTFDSFTARRAVEACHSAGIDVPASVAVLAGEHDELVSKLANPPLSSLDHSPEQVGRRAARLLADLLANRVAAPVSIELPTGGVITRQSTDMLAIDDPLVAMAVRFIRERAHEGISVEDVVARVRASRRLLEQRFRKFFDRTPAEEIRRVKVERACKLLASGNEPLEDVAAACGFDYAEVMTRVFRRHTGMTPSAYRRRFHT
jgi:LacI family transcriptional regulator